MLVCSAAFFAALTRRIRSLFCSRSRFLAASAFCAFASSSAVRETSCRGGTKEPMKLKYISTFCRLSPMDLSASRTMTFSINSLSIGAVNSSKLAYRRTSDTNRCTFMPSSAWAVMPSFSSAVSCSNAVCCQYQLLNSGPLSFVR